MSETVSGGPVGRRLVVMALAMFTLVPATAHAQARLRTPPVKFVTAQGVASCDLMNHSGQPITVDGLRIGVKALEGGTPRTVVSVPGPVTLEDGRGIRGSTPAGVFPFRTVYCEVLAPVAPALGASQVLFTMTVDEGSKKVTTVAPR